MGEFIAFSYILTSLLMNQILGGKVDVTIDKIYFEFYKRSNEKCHTSNSFDGNLPISTGCRSNDNLSIIVHGWTENCNEVWIKELIENLNTVRKGCIVCMNYSEYSKNPKYVDLVAQFDSLAMVLTNKLNQFSLWKFNTDNMYLFGFSFGGQLALESGRRFGKRRISRIDTCDSAGVGFDSNETYSHLNDMDSAKFVHCVHTSNNAGTIKRNCHQNWVMGNCGISQIASGPPPKLHSHVLCPYFYNSAFQNKFAAIPKPIQCDPSKRLPPNISIYTNVSMGYFQPFQCCYGTNGYDYYANTYALPPYSKESS